VCVYTGGVARESVPTVQLEAGVMEEYAREPWYDDGHRHRECCGGAQASHGRRAGEEAPATQCHIPASGDLET
jgi:hypothetical protein